MKRALIAFSLCLPAAAQAEHDTWLRLLATTDMHGHLANVPKLATRIKAERARTPGHVLLLDGGDLFTGTLESDLGEGAGMIRAMNATGYDATAVGNHDFDFGPIGPRAVVGSPGDDPLGALKARVKEAKFPFLTSNIVDAGGRPVAGARAFVLVEAAGTKIGLVGGTTESTPRTTIKPNLKGLTIRPLADSVADAAAAAHAAGATVVVAVVHAGSECPPRALELTDAQPGDNAGCERDGEMFVLARRLAELARAQPTRRVDAIVGGHTHQMVNAVVDGIPLVQGPPSALGFGEIDLELDGRGRPTGHFRVEPPAPVGRDTPPDAEVQRAIAPDLAAADQRRAQPVGVRLDGKLSRAYKAESPMGNLFAEIVRRSTRTDVGILNGGGLRADLPTGELSYGALFETLPFANRAAVITLSGKQLKQLVADNLRGSGGILSIAGATVEARCTQGGLGVTITLASGKVVGDGDQVRVGTSDFLALGGDDFGHLSYEAPRVDDEGPSLRDVIAQALKARGVVRGDDLTLYDPAHPHLRLPSPRPVRCP